MDVRAGHGAKADTMATAVAVLRIGGKKSECGK